MCECCGCWLLCFSLVTPPEGGGGRERHTIVLALAELESLLQTKKERGPYQDDNELAMELFRGDTIQQRLHYISTGSIAAGQHAIRFIGEQNASLRFLRGLCGVVTSMAYVPSYQLIRCRVMEAITGEYLQLFEHGSETLTTRCLAGSRRTEEQHVHIGQDLVRRSPFLLRDAHHGGHSLQHGVYMVDIVQPCEGLLLPSLLAEREEGEAAILCDKRSLARVK